MKNIKSNCEINTKSIDNTSQEKGDFWVVIHNETYEYDLKSVPGGLIRKHKTTGIISIVFSDLEITNGEYGSISYSLYKNSLIPNDIAANTITELDPKKRYRLIILAYKKTKTATGENVHDESWVIDFLPDKPTKPRLKKSTPAT